MIITLLLSCITGATPGTDSFKELFARDEIASLAARSGKRIGISPDLAKHFLSVKCETQDPELELGAVAEALRASLVPVTRGLELKRLPRDIAAARKRWIAERAVWIRAALVTGERARAAQRADLDPLSAFQAAVRQRIEVQRRVQRGDPNAYANFRLDTLAPADGLALKLADKIGAEELAGLRVNRPSIYSDRPAGAEKLLPDCEDLLQKCSDGMAALKGQAPPPNFPMPLLFVGVGRDSQPIAHVRLAVIPGQSHLDAILEAFDAKGNLVCKGYTGASNFEGVQETPDGLVAQAATGTPADVQRIPDERLLRAVHSSSRDTLAPPDWLLRPSKVEPLTVYGAFGMEALAGRQDAPCIVIDLDDELVGDAKYCVQGSNFNVAGLRSVLKQWNPYETAHGNRFAAWRPADPDLAPPLDRKDLERFARDSWLDGYVELRRRLVLAQGNSPLVGVWNGELYKLLPEMRTPGMVPSVGSVGGLIGALPDADWGALLSGQRRTAEQMGVVDALLECFNGAAIAKSRQRLPELYQHPAELYEGADFGQTVMRVDGSDLPEYRIRDLASGKWTTWAPLTGGIYQGHLTAKLVNGQPTITSTRDEFESRWDDAYMFQTGVSPSRTFVVDLPAGAHLEAPLPAPVVERSGDIRYRDLPQAVRDLTWRNACAGAMSGLPHNGTGASGN